MNLNDRTVKYFNTDNRWVGIDPENIKEGMTFQVFESNGSPVIQDRAVIFTAASDSKNIGGIITVQVIIDPAFQILS
jgi:hypothetical protein